MRKYAVNYAEAEQRLSAPGPKVNQVSDFRMVHVTEKEIPAWLDFFDHDAFIGNPSWASCFCLEPHQPAGDEEPERPWRGTRKIMEDRIVSGKTYGYLAYDGDRAVGWINASLRSQYQKYRFDDTESPQAESVIGISCFLVTPAYRGNGVAFRMLERVVADARARGAAWVEGYPLNQPEASDAGHFRGTAAMYERLGFQKVQDKGEFSVYRLEVAPEVKPTRLRAAVATILSLFVPGIGFSISGATGLAAASGAFFVAWYLALFTVFLGSPTLFVVWSLVLLLVWLSLALVQGPTLRSAARKFGSVRAACLRAGAYGLLLAIGILGVASLRSSDVFRYRTFTVPSGAMEPGFPMRSDIVVDRAPSARATVRAGDVVLIEHLVSPKYTFSRVIAVGPGVLNYDGRVFSLDGKTIEDPFGWWAQDYVTDEATERDYHLESLPEPVVLTENQVFCVGDNRAAAKDSRFYGPVLRREIAGKVLYDTDYVFGGDTAR